MKRRDFIQHAAISVAAMSAMPVATSAAANFDAQIKPSNLPENLLPREVRLRTKLNPYELHVDPGGFALYFTQPNNVALRWSVGIGRPGLYESGTFYVGAKKKWPGWTPTQDMIKRSPGQYKKFENGMPGGPNNPLGARALYLFQPQRGDTFLRIHGTNAPNTIGRRVSNGCARLVNDQIVGLYDMIPMQTRVVLHPTSVGN
ncbi:MAG: L,D-transpeptidase [Paracoccaceae bacterium]